MPIDGPLSPVARKDKDLTGAGVGRHNKKFMNNKTLDAGASVSHGAARGHDYCCDFERRRHTHHLLSCQMCLPAGAFQQCHLLFQGAWKATRNFSHRRLHERRNVLCFQILFFTSSVLESDPFSSNFPTRFCFPSSFLSFPRNFSHPPPPPTHSSSP